MEPFLPLPLRQEELAQVNFTPSPTLPHILRLTLHEAIPAIETNYAQVKGQSSE